MVNHKISCDDCNEKIIIYYDKKYKGNRGKCPNCMINFPLE